MKRIAYAAILLSVLTASCAFASGFAEVTEGSYGTVKVGKLFVGGQLWHHWIK